MADFELESRGGAGGRGGLDETQRSAPSSRRPADAGPSAERSAEASATATHVARASRFPARLAVSPDRRVRLPLGLRDLRPGRAQRRGRVDVPAPLRRPERVRRAAGPRRRHVPARPGGHDGAGRPPLPPGDERAGDELGHPPGLADRPRRAAGRPVARHRRALEHPPPRAHRPRRRARAPAHHALRQRLGRGPPRVRPDLRLRPAVRALGVRRLRLQRGRRQRRGLADQAHAHHRPARRLRGLARPRGHHAQGRRHRVRRARLFRPRRARRPTRRPTSGSSAPPTSGTPGSPTARSRTTRGASTCSARRSRSRASPTRPPAR